MNTKTTSMVINYVFYLRFVTKTLSIFCFCDLIRSWDTLACCWDVKQLTNHNIRDLRRLGDVSMWCWCRVCRFPGRPLGERGGRSDREANSCWWCMGRQVGAGCHIKPLCRSVCLPVRLSVCLSVSVTPTGKRLLLVVHGAAGWCWVSHKTSLSVCLSACPSVCLSVSVTPTGKRTLAGGVWGRQVGAGCQIKPLCRSVCLPVRLSVCLFVCLSVSVAPDLSMWCWCRVCRFPG